MQDSTDSAAPGTVARAHRATAIAARDEAWRAFIIHTGDCAHCITTGRDCDTAAILKQAWRDAKAGAA